MRKMMMLMALAFVPLAGPALAQVPMMSPILPDGTLLDITAEGKTTRVPDVATIRSGVVTQGATAAAALADNAARMARVLAAIKRAGVQPRDVQTANVSLSPQYRYADGKPPEVTGYQASNTVSIRFRDIARSGAILDALVGEGANQIDGPNLSIDKPEAALDEARNDAVKQARARAELYARAAGLSVARIVSISEAGQNDGGSPPPRVFAMAARDKVATTEVAAGEADIIVTLSVRFLLK
ncbi:SIMPL domain-containing protein [Sphingomonas sp. AR_OL41]|uniref:SIMPL domain-containing protein n=1 Tax=Sphingomonas sp. AR_OL41 TaxID=3042729 RepID=UPI00248157B7|nr:SIMPL domain-containing protein [Sphingomonas sp. AR_OL41]MDH7972786.1 SIMPL domain-containing protein [Sphingomonas sp. AR_OL41]